MTRPKAASARARAWRSRFFSGLLAFSLLVAFAPGAQAATATNIWLAKLGTAGANGTATVNAFTTGTGNVVLKLKKLKASSTLAVVLLKASCKGSTLLTLASVRTSSTGAVTRTSSLTASQATAIKKATAGTAKFAIRIGTGTTAKCALFVAQTVPAYIAGSVTVGGSPSGVAVDATGVWVANWWDNTLSRINPATNTVLSVIPVTVPDTEGPETPIFGGGSLWLTTTEFDSAGAPLPGSVLRIDPATGALLATIPVGRDNFLIAYGAGAVWVANYTDGNVQRIDPATNTVVATIVIAGALGVAADATSVWAVSVAGTVSRIDPATNTVVATIFTQTTGAYIALGGGSVWLTNQGTDGAGNGMLTRINPATNQVVASIPIGDFPGPLAVAGGSVWVGLSGTESAVVRVNASTNAVMSRTPVVTKVYALTAVDHAVWAVHNLVIPEGGTEPPDGVVTRIGF